MAVSAGRGHLELAPIPVTKRAELRIRAASSATRLSCRATLRTCEGSHAD